MAHRLQYRRDTKANWLKYNPVLMEGEVGYETDTHHQKVGDGVSKYSELEYEVGVGNITQEMGDSETLVMSQKAVNSIFIKKENIVNDVNVGGTDKVLSAELGKKLSKNLSKNTDIIYNISEKIENKNLLNPNDDDVMFGYRQASGNPIITSDYNLTGYIIVEEGKSYHFSAIGSSNFIASFVSFFSVDNDTPISYVENQHTITIPSNVCRIRLTCSSNTELSNIMVELGDSYTGFESYANDYKIKEKSLPIITEEKIKDKNITKDKLSDDITEKLENISEINSIIDTINLVNIYDKDVSIGYLTDEGKIVSNDVYKTTGFIHVEQGFTYYLHAKENNFSARYVLFFNSTKTVITGSRVENIREITIPDNAVYIRATIQVSNGAWNVAQITKGELYNYRPYRVILGDSIFFPNNSISYKKISGLESVVSSLGTNYIRGVAQNLEENSIYELTEAPLYIKNCNNISFGCKITQFGSFYIGKGYNSRNGVYLKITNTLVQYIWYYSTETILAEIEHGIDMSNVQFIRVSILSDYDRNIKVIISTNNGDFVDTQKIEYDSAGKTFIKSESLLASDVLLNYNNSQLKESVWVFGDSYTSLINDRWTGRLYINGIKKYLLCGIPGGYSQQMYNDVIRCLSMGTPKYLVWCLGMNDRVSNTYSIYLNQLIELCNQKGILLVLMKIPQVPMEDGYMSIEEAVNQYVIASGLPYIDAYSAVGSNSEGYWYDGMLSNDSVHPTSKGAQALASQVLIDFPQLMECVL